MYSLLKLLGTVLNSLLKGVPAASMPGGPITPSSTTTILKIERKSITIDGIFGEIWINGTLVCECVENLSKAVAEGLYDATVDVSPRLGYPCPHIAVPMRDKEAGGDAGIRIHILNEPCQSEGCIGPGTNKDGDAEDNSKTAFNEVMALLPSPGVPFKVLIYSVH